MSRLHCQHQQTQYALRSRVRHLTDELPRLEQRLHAVRQDLATRQDTTSDRFVMTIEGELVRDRGSAGELLLRRAARMRGSQAERLVGALAGFQVFVADSLLPGPQILLKGAITNTARVTATALGTIRSGEMKPRRASATTPPSAASTRTASSGSPPIRSVATTSSCWAKSPTRPTPGSSARTRTTTAQQAPARRGIARDPEGPDAGASLGSREAPATTSTC